MEERAVRPFLEATKRLIEKYTGAVPEERGMKLLKRETPMAYDVTGLIGLAGDSRGAVAISFSEAVILRLYARMTRHVASSIDADVKDWVGEMVNIVAGNAKQGLENFRLVISLPTVIQGRNHLVTWPVGDAPIIQMLFAIPEGEFAVTVVLRDIVR